MMSRLAIVRASFGPLFSVLLMGLTFAVQAKEQPAWVTEPPHKAGMAYGVGSMEIYGNPQAAIKRATELARADLVSSLQVTVSGDFSSLDRLETDSTSSSHMRSSVSNYVRSQIPTVELNEARVSATYVDQRVAYVLVELNRMQEVARLAQQISTVELDLVDLASRPVAGNTLQQLQALLPALALLAKRDQLAERMAFFSESGQQTPPLAEVKALQERIYKLLDALVVRLSLVDAGAKELGGSMLEALSKQGLRVQDSSAADLTFQVQASLNSKTQAGSHYVFIDARVTIVDTQGRVLNSFSKQAKGVSGIADKAKQAALNNIAQVIADELAATLVEKLK